MEGYVKHPIHAWLEQHAEAKGTETERKAWQLIRATNAVDSANWEGHAWIDWFANRAKPEPDAIRCIAAYGTARLLVDKWKEFPIPMEPGTEEAWRHWGLETSLDEFEAEQIASVIGGTLEVAGRDPQLSMRLIRRQLYARLEALGGILALPTEWFDVENLSELEWEEEEGEDEVGRLNRPFSLMDDLSGFITGFPELRMIAMTETVPELNLPNIPLYEALMEIDINSLMGKVREFESKLKPILRHLSKQTRVTVADPYAPDAFWWRHWKPEHKQSSAKQKRS